MKKFLPILLTLIITLPFNCGNPEIEWKGKITIREDEAKYIRKTTDYKLGINFISEDGGVTDIAFKYRDLKTDSLYWSETYEMVVGDIKEFRDVYFQLSEIVKTPDRTYEDKQKFPVRTRIIKGKTSAVIRVGIDKNNQDKIK